MKKISFFFEYNKIINSYRQYSNELQVKVIKNQYSQFITLYNIQ